MKNERQSFRIDYPLSDRPTFLYQLMRFEIMDLSETGAQIKAHGFPLQANQTYNGFVQFKDGERYPVKGSVVRVDFDKGTAALKFSLGVPYKKMVSEQLRLKKKQER